MEMTYLAQPPQRWTFRQPKLKEWVERHCVGKVLNLFAGMTFLNVDETRVDLNEDAPADFHMDAHAFVDMAIDENMQFQTIILDPPYSVRKSKTKYMGRVLGNFTRLKNKLPQIISDNGIVISLGYDTTGMSKSRGFHKIAVCVICHNGDHHDTLCVVEKKVGAIQPSFIYFANNMKGEENMEPVKAVNSDKKDVQASVKKQGKGGKRLLTKGGNQLLEAVYIFDAVLNQGVNLPEGVKKAIVSARDTAWECFKHEQESQMQMSF